MKESRVATPFEKAFASLHGALSFVLSTLYLPSVSSGNTVLSFYRRNFWLSHFSLKLWLRYPLLSALYLLSLSLSLNSRPNLTFCTFAMLQSTLHKVKANWNKILFTLVRCSLLASPKKNVDYNEMLTWIWHKNNISRVDCTWNQVELSPRNNTHTRLRRIAWWTKGYEWKLSSYSKFSPHFLPWRRKKCGEKAFFPPHYTRGKTLFQSNQLPQEEMGSPRKGWKNASFLARAREKKEGLTLTTLSIFPDLIWKEDRQIRWALFVDKRQLFFLGKRHLLPPNASLRWTIWRLITHLESVSRSWRR